MTLLSRLKAEGPLHQSEFRASGLILAGFYLLALGSAAMRPVFNAGMTLGEAVLTAETVWLLPVSLLFLVSAFMPKLFWLQPFTLLATVPFSFRGDTDSMYGLGSFVIASVMMFRFGSFRRRGVIHLIFLVCYLVAAETAAILAESTQHIVKAFVPVLYTFVLLSLLFILYREKITVYLKEPKPGLSLAEAGLSRTEADYVRAMLSGKSIKEIAQEAGRRDSTVRNTLSRAYRKMGVPDRAGLMAKLEKFEVGD